ncbi:MAG: LysR family transcriptional regulator [Magnetospiraceae bacterium]
MDLVDGLKAFVATAQTGSFTGAAERLGISNRLTSKYVAQLEYRMGARLLQRTTRKVGLTPTGQALVARASVLLDELDDMMGAVGAEAKGLSGLLRISAPVSFGEVYIADLLRRFAAPYPDLTVDLRLNDAYVDLAAQGIDVAFRIGRPETASLKARKLGAIKSSVVAAPDYLARSSAPRRPVDLMDHMCIVDTNRRDGGRWLFREDGEERVVSVPRRYMVNSARVARDWAVAGYGITYGPDFVLAEDIAAGRLVRLLEPYAAAEHPMNAIYLDGNVLPRKVRTLIDFAVKDVKERGILAAKQPSN